MTAGAQLSVASPVISIRERMLRPTLAELWLFLGVALPVLASLIAAMSTVDLAYQLRAGAGILDGSRIPMADAWTFTAAGLPWLDQQWGAQVLLAQVFSTAGWTGLVLLRAVLIGLVSGSILVAIRVRAPAMHPRYAALLALAAFVVYAPALALRPQLLAMPLFGVTLVVLAVNRTRPHAMWAMPVIGAIWANLHGSFVLAPLLVGLAIVEGLGRGDRGARAGTRQRLVVLIATLASTFATPFGWRVWEYAIGIAGNAQITAQVSEWQPPMLTEVPGLLFWGSVAMTIVAIVLLVRRGHRIRIGALLGLIGFAALGSMASRGVAWWPGMAVVTVAGLWADGRSADADDRRSAAPSGSAPSGSAPSGSAPSGSAPSGSAPSGSAPTVTTSPGRRLNALVGAIIIGAAIALLPAWRPVDAGTGAPAGVLTDAPSGITRALRAIAQPGDRVWNPQAWGSWLEFALPDPLYALDSRIEVIPAGTWADAAVLVAGEPGWPDILAGADVTIVITEGPDSALAAALASSPEWTVVYADEDGTIWQPMR